MWVSWVNVKDSKCKSSVEMLGEFVPLVVETLGLWIPFAKKILRSIASRNTLCNGPSWFAHFSFSLQVTEVVLSYIAVCVTTSNIKRYLPYLLIGLLCTENQLGRYLGNNVVSC